MTDSVSEAPQEPIVTPPRRRRALVVGAIVAGAVVLVAGGAGIAYGVGAGQHTPEQQVRAFLQDLVGGRAEFALERVNGVPTSNPLLTDKGYAGATDRISAFEIVSDDVAVNPQYAIVSTRITQGDTEYEHDFTLVRAGKDFVFDVWHLDKGQLPKFQVSFPHPAAVTATAGGQDLGTNLDTVSALPGTYEFAGEGTSDSYSIATATGTVTFENAEDAVDVSLEVALTEQGVAAAQAAVAAHTDSCLAQPVLQPAGGCGFGINDDGYAYTNQRWTLLTRPTVSFGAWSGDTTTGGWSVIPGTMGGLRWDADIPGGTADAVWDDYMPSGRVTFADDGTATFASDVDLD